MANADWNGTRCGSQTSAARAAASSGENCGDSVTGGPALESVNTVTCALLHANDRMHTVRGTWSGRRSPTCNGWSSLLTSVSSWNWTTISAAEELHKTTSLSVRLASGSRHFAHQAGSSCKSKREATLQKPCWERSWNTAEFTTSFGNRLPEACGPDQVQQCIASSARESLGRTERHWLYNKLARHEASLLPKQPPHVENDQRQQTFVAHQGVQRWQPWDMHACEHNKLQLNYHRLDQRPIERIYGGLATASWFQPSHADSH